MARKNKKKKTLAFKNAVAGYLFIAPFIIGFILFLVVPLVQSLRMSFSTVELEGGLSMTWAGLENYRQAFQQDTEKNQQALAAAVSQAPVLYAYPFGLYTNASEEVLKAMGYRITLTCEERVNWITRDPDCLYLLGRFNRPHGIRSADFFAPGRQGPAAITGSTTGTAVQMGPAGPGR